MPSPGEYRPDDRRRSGQLFDGGPAERDVIGFTGTPVDKTIYGKGTFKTFGGEDDKGYLHKYSISETIEDGTTLPLYYDLRRLAHRADSWARVCAEELGGRNGDRLL